MSETVTKHSWKDTLFCQCVLAVREHRWYRKEFTQPQRQSVWTVGLIARALVGTYESTNGDDADVICCVLVYVELVYANLPLYWGSPLEGSLGFFKPLAEQVWRNQFAPPGTYIIVWSPPEVGYCKVEHTDGKFRVPRVNAVSRIRLYDNQEYAVAAWDRYNWNRHRRGRRNYFPGRYDVAAATELRSLYFYV